MRLIRVLKYTHEVWLSDMFGSNVPLIREIDKNLVADVLRSV